MLSPGRGRRSGPLIRPKADPVLGGPGAVPLIETLVEVERLLGSLGLQEKGLPLSRTCARARATNEVVTRLPMPSRKERREIMRGPPVPDASRGRTDQTYCCSL